MNGAGNPLVSHKTIGSITAGRPFFQKLIYELLEKRKQ